MENSASNTHLKQIENNILIESCAHGKDIAHSEQAV